MMNGKTMMNGGGRGMADAADPEMDLYRSAEGDEESSGSTIPKSLLPGEVSVGTRLEVTEDLGDEVRVRIEVPEEEPEPERALYPGGETEEA